MSETLFPPSINNEAISLAERTGRIRSMYQQHNRTTLEQARQIGTELNYLKDHCQKAGKVWLKELLKTEVNERTAQDYMRLASNYGQIESHIRSAADGKTVSIREAIEVIKSEPEKKHCSRECRVGKGPKVCKNCAKLNGTQSTQAASDQPQTTTEPTAEESSPETDTEAPMPIEEVLALAKDYEAAAKRAKRLGKMVRKIEGTDAFRKSAQGKPGYLSDKLINVFRTLESLKPEEACSTCDGDVQANEDADPCAACGGKGFLTAFDKRKSSEQVL